MALELVGHICQICGSAFQTRQKAKKHVMRAHLDRVHHRHGPGQHVEYLWLEMRNYGQAPKTTNGSEKTEMGTTIQILISIERDSDNTGTSEKLVIQPSFDGKMIFLSITGEDRQITINAADLELAMKSVGGRE